ncbi:hypothetical protein D9611_014459 [Ephemerocybe angulata]|uniref:Uncharacterized protein n=1 Tax=Ephemerocybe angulata TaxID=980116 RepID=A0A8H5ERI0_9AGAR|nr:hypothetical protein D9611_014459 [Tulosesus angulatus]
MTSTMLIVCSALRRCSGRLRRPSGQQTRVVWDGGGVGCYVYGRVHDEGGILEFCSSSSVWFACGLTDDLGSFLRHHLLSVLPYLCSTPLLYPADIRLPRVALTIEVMAESRAQVAACPPRYRILRHHDMTVFSALLYFSKRGTWDEVMDATQLASIPAAAWFVIVSEYSSPSTFPPPPFPSTTAFVPPTRSTSRPIPTSTHSPTTRLRLDTLDVGCAASASSEPTDDTPSAFLEPTASLDIPTYRPPLLPIRTDHRRPARPSNLSRSTTVRTHHRDVCSCTSRRSVAGTPRRLARPLSSFAPTLRTQTDHSTPSSLRILRSHFPADLPVLISQPPLPPPLPFSLDPLPHFRSSKLRG